jgi:hypothetical protein
MLSMKISHVLNHIANQMRNLYLHLSKEKCKSDVKIHNNLLALAHVDPKNLPLLLFNQPGYLALIRSEVIYIQKCQEVNVVVRKTDECTIELPITYDNRSLYLTPKSRIIVQTGERIQCSDAYPSTFRIDNMWFERSYDGNLKKAIPPTSIEVSRMNEWKFEEISGFVDK